MLLLFVADVKSFGEFVSSKCVIVVVVDVVVVVVVVTASNY